MQRFKQILCVLEHGALSKPALDRAVALANSNQASLTVVSVAPTVLDGVRLPGGGLTSTDLQSALVQRQETLMTSILAPYLERINIRHKVLLGIGFLEVIREVLRNGHDLVIKCPESPGWLDRLFAGDDMHLMRKCPCPVWFIKPQAPKAYKRILAAVDVDDLYPPHELETRHLLNEQVLEMSAGLALSESAELHIVHAWNSMTEMVDGLAFSTKASTEQTASGIETERHLQQQRLELLVQTVRAKNSAAREALDYLKPVTHVVKGSARKEVPQLAAQLAADCIVMGTVARTGIRGFIMGNTAETILEQIDCSVLAIKPAGFVTPVEPE